MQEFDPKITPNLSRLDERVRKLLSSERASSWDTARTEYEICRIHPVYWMEQYGYIRPGAVVAGADSGAATEPIPFKLNRSQLVTADRICAHFTHDPYTRVQIVVLKHRKVGVSTLIAAFDYWLLRFMPYTHAFVIADLASHTDNIIAMVDLFHQRDTCGASCTAEQHRPPRRVSMGGTKKGLKFSNGSIIEQDSGENKNPATSATLSVVHMSENAKWRDPGTAETSILNSVPRTGFAFVVKESTAFGINKFATDWEEAERGSSSWEPVFLSWLDMPDCEDDMVVGETLDLTQREKELMASYPKMTLGHVKFRRRQIATLGSEQAFTQDFPLNSREPFLVTGSNFFDVDAVQARITEVSLYRDWKAKGIEYVRTVYPENVSKMQLHPRGLGAALDALERDCVIPRTVTMHEGPDGMGFVRDPEARPGSGAAIMYREPRPGRSYLVTVDVAEGRRTSESESDNSVIQVVDVRAREQVLEWAGLFDEEVTASYAVAIARLYNNAMLAPELNNKCGGLLMAELQRYGYKNWFYRETVEGGSRRRREPGWVTRPASKRDVYGQMRLDFKNGVALIHSVDLLGEMLHFIDVQGKLQGAEGHKDDRISAMAIALKIIAMVPDLGSSKTGQAGMRFGSANALGSRDPRTSPPSRRFW